MIFFLFMVWFMALLIGALMGGINDESLLNMLARRATKKRVPRKTLVQRKVHRVQHFTTYLLGNLSRRWPNTNWWMQKDCEGAQIFARKKDGTSTVVMSLYTNGETILSPYFLMVENPWNKTYAWTLLGLSRQINRLVNMNDFDELVGEFAQEK